MVLLICVAMMKELPIYGINFHSQAIGATINTITTITEIYNLNHRRKENYKLKIDPLYKIYPSDIDLKKKGSI